MHDPRHDREAGFTFAEMAFAILIMVIGAVVLIEHISVNYRTTATERDRVFAYSKAQAILAEIQAFVDRGQVDAAVDLDVLDDGIVSKNPLTIQTEGGALVAADHAVSGNYQRGGQWVWCRRITVQPFLGLNNRNVRYVTVRIFKRDADGNENPMADLSAVINSAGSAFPTTQVFDVYLLAVENIPGWWVFMDSIKPFVESMISDLENRNPGLTFRTHWITKASFGRNQAYRPYTNDSTDSYTPVPDVYHYPGRMPAGNASAYYYVPDNMRARVNVDGTERHGYDATVNPNPYALADYYNHAMRYPDELALWRTRVAAVEQREQEIRDAQIAGITPPPELEDMSKEPTLRLFFEDLYSDPDKYKNALIINLHGELMPMPALRNFSDAARDPVAHPDVRVVTHPEELRTKNDDGGVTDSVRLRMYAYKTRYDASAPNDPGGLMSDPMVVEIAGVNLTDSSNPTRLQSACVLSNIKGLGGTNLYSLVPNAIHVSDGPAAGEMYYEAQYVGAVESGGHPFTRIYLYNTPIGAPADNDGRGLANSERARLYEMEYVPCPPAAGPSFATDLTTIGVGSKNTARWMLELEPALLSDSCFVDNAGAPYNPTGDVLLQIRTRIASGYVAAGEEDWQQSGTMWPTPIQPDNLSVTYAWWSDSKEDVPITERSQFNGDPRHCPYKDCFNNGDDFPNSCNWYHTSLNNGGENATGDFPSINSTYLRNRWNGLTACDVPRYFEMVRAGLVRSACVYTTLTGFSYYYIGIGADIGYDSANGYPWSIPSDMTPYGGTGTGYVNNITGGRRYVANALVANYWWGMPWLGELYPDSQVAQWLDTSGGTPHGNLLAGNVGADRFLQYWCSIVYGFGNRTAYGTTINDHHQITSTNGCSCLFNVGTAASAFRHLFSVGTGTLTAVGQEIADNYSMTMPATAPVSRPFVLNDAGNGGNHWNYPPYSTNRYTGSIFKTYYTHPSGTGSALVKLVDPGNTSAAYVVVNGIDRAVESGTTFIAKFAVLSLVHSFLEAGSTTNTLRIPQLPRVEIESPTDITELDDPADISVQYDVAWTRWDGQPYSATGTFAEDEAELEYVLMYSNDNGTSWFFVQDDSPAVCGVRPSAAYVVPDAGAGVENYTWSVPAAQFPEGSYLLRIDCYRQGAQVHYAFHQNKVFIQR